MSIEIHLKLISDATFGRGDGVAGLIDQEIEHDSATGLPFLRGRTLKGLLVEECSNILYALKRQASPAHGKFEDVAGRIFGQAGSQISDDAIIHFGAAMLPRELCDAVEADIKRKELRAEDVLESLTAIRRQTAVDEATGAPEQTTLRSMRVLLRETELIAELDCSRSLYEEEKALLAACVMSFQRAGTGRNRGRGRLKAELHNESGDVTSKHFGNFKKLTAGEPI